MRDVTLSPTPVIPLKGMPASAPHVNARSDAASTAKISGAAERTLAWLGPRAFSPRFDPAGKAEPDACRGERAPNGGPGLRRDEADPHAIPVQSYIPITRLDTAPSSAAPPIKMRGCTPRRAATNTAAAAASKAR